MKQIRFLYPVWLVLFSFVGNGCLSVSNSPMPKFYTLPSIDNAGEVKKFEISHKVIIGIGPIEIPEYQNRPQMVTKNQDGLLKFAQFERWGESLDAGSARLISENLILMLP
ncbi:MAG: hypothetical protein COV73_01810, partial [Candidatus Omnitrophica bacterium CG11_big_fil_rev_8_21_14_0_20_43_6]